MTIDSPQAVGWTHRLMRLATPGVSNRRRGYDPNQPRVPAGHSDGGQWTAGGAQPDAPKEFGELALALSLGRAKPAFGSASQNSNSQSAQDRPQPIGERIPRPSEFGGLSLVDQLAIERTTQKLQQILLTVNSIVSSRRDPVSARLYGIAVHKAFADAVRAEIYLASVGME